MSENTVNEKLVLTDEMLEDYRKGMMIIGLVTAIVNIIGIGYILKCPFSIIGSYKWHLLNIAVCSCIMDLHFSLIFIGFPLFPVLGFCSVGFTSGLGRFLGGDVQYLIFIQLFGVYGLSVLNAILYHMTKIVGAKSILKSKKALITGVTIQFVYPMPCWIYHLFIIPTKDEMKNYVEKVAPNAVSYIESHACSVMVKNPKTYIYIALSGLMVFVCSITVFICCGLAVLLLLRNKSGKTSKEYKMFKSMTIGLISQIVGPMLTVLVPMFFLLYKINTKDDNPANYTPLAFQILSLHSIINIVAMVIFTSPLRQGLGISPQETETVGNELFERRHPLPSRPQTTAAVVAFSEQL